MTRSSFPISIFKGTKFIFVAADVRFATLKWSRNKSLSHRETPLRGGVRNGNRIVTYTYVALIQYGKFGFGAEISEQFYAVSHVYIHEVYVIFSIGKGVAEIGREPREGNTVLEFKSNSLVSTALYSPDSISKQMSGESGSKRQKLDIARWQQLMRQTSARWTIANVKGRGGGRKRGISGIHKHTRVNTHSSYITSVISSKV